MGQVQYLPGLFFLEASLMAQTVKHLPAMWETWVRSLDQEDTLEKEMATHSSILAWKSHGWWSVAGYSPWGRRELATTERLHFPFLFFSFLLRVRPSLSPGCTHYGILLKYADEVRSSVISLLGDIHHRRSSVVRRIKWDKT